MTEQEFKTAYCERSNIKKEEFDNHFVVLRCQCSDSTCQGWACVSNDKRSIEIHKKFYQR